MGHPADTVHSEGLSGSKDSKIAEAARADGRVIFTLDKGFADIRAYPPKDYPGLVLFRPPSSGRGAILGFVRNRIADLVAINLAGQLVVVTERGLRVRN